jgi:acetolactate synthase-1/2/3 large subunit
MESPRGINDPSLGALAEVLPDADLVVLLAKNLDFTLQSNGELVFDSKCRFIHLDADKAGFDLARRAIPDPSLIVQSAMIDPVSSINAMREAATQRSWQAGDWFEQVKSAIAYRPPAWTDIDSGKDGPLHPVEVCRGVQEYLDQDEAVFISDGGEFGQWAQACLHAPHRVINGPSGAIGGSIPFALAASLAFPGCRVVVTLGDGTFGFHPLEFDTAARHQLPFVAVVGNDATWNAEYQIQLRKFGRERTVGCELLPTRYDQAVESLGGHGENITASHEILPALHRAQESGLPACLNVPIVRTAAPLIRRSG